MGHKVKKWTDLGLPKSEKLPKVEKNADFTVKKPLNSQKQGLSVQPPMTPNLTKRPSDDSERTVAGSRRVYPLSH